MARISSDTFAPAVFDSYDARAAVERAAQERAAKRLSQLEAQSSPLFTPQERVQHWEDFHGVRLPTDPNHKLVGVIALDTALAIDQVRDEQTRRHTAAGARHP